MDKSKLDLKTAGKKRLEEFRKKKESTAKSKSKPNSSNEDFKKDTNANASKDSESKDSSKSSNALQNASSSSLKNEENPSFWSGGDNEMASRLPPLRTKLPNPLSNPEGESPKDSGFFTPDASPTASRSESARSRHPFSPASSIISIGSEDFNFSFGPEDIKVPRNSRLRNQLPNQTESLQRSKSTHSPLLTPSSSSTDLNFGSSSLSGWVVRDKYVERLEVKVVDLQRRLTYLLDQDPVLIDLDSLRQEVTAKSEQIKSLEYETARLKSGVGKKDMDREEGKDGLLSSLPSFSSVSSSKRSHSHSARIVDLLERHSVEMKDLQDKLRERDERVVVLEKECDRLNEKFMTEVVSERREEAIKLKKMQTDFERSAMGLTERVGSAMQQLKQLKEDKALLEADVAAKSDELTEEKQRQLSLQSELDEFRRQNESLMATVSALQEERTKMVSSQQEDGLNESVALKSAMDQAQSEKRWRESLSEELERLRNYIKEKENENQILLSKVNDAMGSTGIDNEKTLRLENELANVSANLESLRQELMKSEQRGQEVREKLSMAVRKGKEVVQQRENLKNNLTELSGKLQQALAAKEAAENLLNSNAKSDDRKEEDAAIIHSLQSQLNEFKMKSLTFESKFHEAVAKMERMEKDNQRKATEMTEEKGDVEENMHKQKMVYEKEITRKNEMIFDLQSKFDSSVNQRKELEEEMEQLNNSTKESESKYMDLSLKFEKLKSESSEKDVRILELEDSVVKHKQNLESSEQKLSETEELVERLEIEFSSLLTKEQGLSRREKELYNQVNSSIEELKSIYYKWKEEDDDFPSLSFSPLSQEDIGNILNSIVSEFGNGVSRYIQHVGVVRKRGLEDETVIESLRQDIEEGRGDLERKEREKDEVIKRAVSVEQKLCELEKENRINSERCKKLDEELLDSRKSEEELKKNVEEYTVKEEKLISSLKKVEGERSLYMEDMEKRLRLSEEKSMSLEKEVKEKDGKFSEVEKEIMEMKEKLSKAVQMGKKVEKQRDELKSKLKEIQKSNSFTESIDEKHTSQLNSLQNEIDRLQMSLKHGEEVQKKNEEEIKLKNDEVNRLKLSLKHGEEMEKKNEEEIKLKSDEIQRLNNDIVQQKEILHEMENAFKEEAVNREEEIRKLNTVISSLQQSNQDWEEEKVKLNSELSNLKDAELVWKQKYQESESNSLSQIQSLEKNIHSLRQRIDVLQNELDSERKVNHKLNSLIVDLEKKHLQLQTALTEKTEKCLSLEMEMENKLKMKENEVKKGKTIIHKLEEKLHSVEKKLTQSNAELEVSRKDLSLTKSELNKVRTEREKEFTEDEISQQSLKSLQLQLSNTHQRLEEERKKSAMDKEEWDEIMKESSQQIAEMKQEMKEKERLLEESKSKSSSFSSETSRLSEQMVKEKEKNEQLMNEIRIRDENLPVLRENMQKLEERVKYEEDEKAKIIHSHSLQMDEMMHKLEQNENGWKKIKEGLEEKVKEIEQKLKELSEEKVSNEKKLTSQLKKVKDSMILLKNRESKSIEALEKEKKETELLLKEERGRLEKAVNEMASLKASLHETLMENEKIVNDLIEKEQELAMVEEKYSETLKSLKEERSSVEERERKLTVQLNEIKSSMDDLLKAKTDAEKKERQLEQKLSEMKKEKEELERNNISSSSLTSAMENSNAVDLKVELEKSNETIAAIRDKLQRAVKKGKGIEQQKMKLEKDLELTSAELSTLKTELDIKVKENLTLLTEIGSLKSKMETMKVSESKNEILKSMEDLTMEVLKKEKDLSSIKSELDQVLSSSKSLSEEKVNLEKNLYESNQAIHQVNTQLTSYSSKVELLEREKEKMRVNLSELQNQITVLTEELDLKNVKISEYEYLVRVKESQLQDLEKSNERIVELESMVEEWREQAEQDMEATMHAKEVSKSKMENLQKQVEDLTRELQGKKTENDHRSEHIQYQEKQIEELKKKVEDLKLEVQEKKTENEDRSELIRNQEKQMEELKSMMEDLRKQVEVMKVELQEKITENEDRSELIRNQEKQIVELKPKLEDLRNQVEVMKVNLQEKKTENGDRSERFQIQVKQIEESNEKISILKLKVEDLTRELQEKKTEDEDRSERFQNLLLSKEKELEKAVAKWNEEEEKRKEVERKWSIEEKQLMEEKENRMDVEMKLEKEEKKMDEMRERMREKEWECMEEEKRRKEMEAKLEEEKTKWKEEENKMKEWMKKMLEEEKKWKEEENIMKERVKGMMEEEKIRKEEEKKNIQLVNSLNILTHKNELLNSSMASLRSELDSKDSEILNLNNALEEEKEKSNQLLFDFSSLKSTLKQKETDLSEITHSFKSVKEKMEIQNQKIKSLEDVLLQAKDSANAQEDKIQEYQNRISVLSLSSDSLTSQIKSLTKDLQTNESVRIKLNQEIKSINEEKEKLVLQINEKENNILHLQNNLSILKVEIEEWKEAKEEDMASLKKTIDRITEEKGIAMEKKEEEMKRLQIQWQEAMDSIQAMEEKKTMEGSEKVYDLENEIRELKSEFDTLQETLLWKESEIEEMKREGEGLISEAEEWRQCSEKKNSMLELTRRERDEMVERMKKMNESIHQSRLEMERVSSEAMAATQYAKNAQVKLEMLKTENEELKRKMEHQKKNASSSPLSSLPHAPSSSHPPHPSSSSAISSSPLNLRKSISSKDPASMDLEAGRMDEGGLLSNSDMNGFKIVHSSFRNLHPSLQQTAMAIDKLCVAGAHIMFTQPRNRLLFFGYWVALHFWVVAMLSFLRV